MRTRPSRLAPLALLFACAAAQGGGLTAVVASPYRLAAPAADYRLAGAAGALSAWPHAGLLEAAAQRNGLDPALVHALVDVESGHDARARSPKGALGLMQLMPETARRYGIRDPLDPAQNAAAGTAYLRDLLRLFGGDLALALAAYNAGEAAVLRHGGRIPPFAETRAYVPKVLARYQRFRREAEAASPYRLAGDWQSRLGRD